MSTILGSVLCFLNKTHKNKSKKISKTPNKQKSMCGTQNKATQPNKNQKKTKNKITNQVQCDEKKAVLNEVWVE